MANTPPYGNSCKWLFLFVIMSLAFCTLSARSQSVVVVSGVLVDSITQKPLDKATLIRLSDNRAFITDRTGSFEIACTDNDAIRISYVGYVTLRVVVRNIPDSMSNKKKYLRIEMRRDLSNLPLIIINENPLELSRKQDSIYYSRALKSPEATLMNPISFLYAQFSKVEKEKSKLNEILQKNYFDDLLNYRLPKQLLMNITGDKTFDLETLKQKCRPNEFFILNASDYELYQWVKNCYAY